MSAPLILVTGATDGIGKWTALELARRGAHVVAHGRDAKKLAATVSALRAIDAATPEPVRADFASLPPGSALERIVNVATRRFYELSCSLVSVPPR